MFQKGEYIIYGNTGVCHVDEVGALSEIPVADKNRVYYKLSPVYGAGEIYIPVDTKVFMRPIMTKEEALDFISKIPEIQEADEAGMDQRMLAERYRGFLQTHQCEDLVQVIKSVYQKNKTLAENGKKPGKVNNDYMKRAEEMLHRELSIALGIPYEEVQGFIQRKVEGIGRMDVKQS